MPHVIANHAYGLPSMAGPLLADTAYLIEARTGRPADGAGPSAAEPDLAVSPARSCRLRLFSGSGVFVC